MNDGSPSGDIHPSSSCENRTPLFGFRYRPESTRGVDQGQSREEQMTNELKIIRKRAKKAINLEAARILMARRQLAGA